MAVKVFVGKEGMSKVWSGYARFKVTVIERVCREKVNLPLLLPPSFFSSPLPKCEGVILVSSR